MRNITPWIPVFGKYKPEREWVTYDRKEDVFTCTMGKTIPFKGFDLTSDGKLIKNYRASKKDCIPCVLNGYSSPKYATIPPKVRHLFLGKVRHQVDSKLADFGVFQCEFSEFRIPGKGRFLTKVRHLFLLKVRH